MLQGKNLTYRRYVISFLQNPLKVWLTLHEYVKAIVLDYTEILVHSLWHN